HFRPAPCLGHSLPPCSLLAHVRSLLLAYAGRRYPPSLESLPVHRTLLQSSLHHRFLPHYAHRRRRNTSLSLSWLSARLLPLLSRRLAQGTPLSTRYRPALGQLSRAWLCLENHPWQ